MSAATPVVPAPGCDRRLFCFFDTARFVHLAAIVSPKLAIWGITIAPGRSVPPAAYAGFRMQDVARRCVDEVRRVQASGPYRLGAFSFGGRVALEVAGQLRAAGEAVELLVVFDTFMPGAYRRRPIRWVLHHLGELMRQGPRYLRRPERRGASPEGAPPPAAADDEHAMAAARLWHFRQALGRDYQPRAYPGEIVLFRATQNPVAPHYRIDRALGWGPIARGQLHVHDVPAAHLDVLDPERAPQVARMLDVYLDRTASHGRTNAPA